MARPSWRRGVGSRGSDPVRDGWLAPGCSIRGCSRELRLWRFVVAMRDPAKRTRAMVICLATAGVLIALVPRAHHDPAQAVIQLGSRWRWQPEAEFPFALSLPWPSRCAA